MHRDTIDFGAPLVGLAVGAAIFVGSLFVTGLSVVSAVGGLIGLASIAALALAVARAADETPSVDLVDRERDDGVGRAPDPK